MWPFRLSRARREARSAWGSRGPRVASEVANTGGVLVHLLRQPGSTHPFLVQRNLAVVPVLAEQAIERAGLVEHSQVLIAKLRPLAVTELGIASPTAPGTDPVSNTVGGQGVVIPANITFISTGSSQIAVLVIAKPTIAPIPRSHMTFVEAELTGDPSLMLRWFSREMKRLPCLTVGLGNGWLKPGVAAAQAIWTQAEAAADQRRRLAAMFTANGRN